MSGIEVAGIVLAVLPLFISAWEDYEEGLRPVKAVFRWEHQLPAHIKSMRDQKYLFELRILQLVAPVTTVEELEALTWTGFDSIWEDDGVQLRIKNRLGKAKAPFMSNMKQFENICKDIADCLDLVEDNYIGPATQDSLEAVLKQVQDRTEAKTSGNHVRFHWKRRIKFGWSKKRITTLLDELEKCNRLIGEIVNTVEILEPLRIKPGRFAVQHLAAVQSRVCGLARALNDAWKCSAHASHLLGIQLENRLGPSDSTRYTPVRMGTSSPECSLFRFAFAASATSQEEHFHELEIAVSKTEPTERKRRHAVRVAFADDDEEAVAVDVAKLSIVQDMCSVVALRDLDRPRGFFFDSTSQRLLGTFPGSATSSFNSEGKLVRLEELLPLPRSAAAKNREVLSKKQRMALAATLASSALQLHSTCFSHDWSKKSIAFVCSLSQHPKLTITVDKPLLIRSILDRPGTEEDAWRSSKQSKSMLLSLGALLLELHSGETADSRMARVGRRGLDNELELALACQDWLAEEQDEVSPAWQQAINFSLRSYSDLNADFANPEFQKLVHDNIVLPLDDDARRFAGSKDRS